MLCCHSICTVNIEVANILKLSVAHTYLSYMVTILGQILPSEMHTLLLFTSVGISHICSPGQNLTLYQLHTIHLFIDWDFQFIQTPYQREHIHNSRHPWHTFKVTRKQKLRSKNQSNSTSFPSLTWIIWSPILWSMQFKITTTFSRHTNPLRQILKPFALVAQTNGCGTMPRRSTHLDYFRPWEAEHSKGKAPLKKKKIYQQPPSLYKGH